MRRAIVVPALVVLLAASRQGGWEVLVRQLAGRFSSEAQARTDPDYFDLRCDGLEIWKEDKEARWLYVERAVPGLLDSPYRQTVYRLADASTAKSDKRRFALDAYAIRDPGRFAGAAADPARLDTMTPEDLVARPGCSILLVRGSDDTFTGGTKGRDCVGDGPGVAYVTSEWTVTKDTLTRWDRGFDAGGHQVWGATKGPYVFRRIVASSSAENAP